MSGFRATTDLGADIKRVKACLRSLNTLIALAHTCLLVLISCNFRPKVQVFNKSTLSERRGWYDRFLFATYFLSTREQEDIHIAWSTPFFHAFSERFSRFHRYANFFHVIYDYTSTVRYWHWKYSLHFSGDPLPPAEDARPAEYAITRPAALEASAQGIQRGRQAAK